ncbi:hypothetical protein HYPSUDRAFT_33255 [Hypholoma sublateritium FD-334 SS-4]|uniref:Alpha/beta hydrolase fold-3 domain-containing protein n=1 Tax=Hypholoma sublateritium (strain FD-334 SS-4) TaxID=945553 RepID=A0A0D2PDC8_HYPSF|nr:hypothetical protein HYPSUDRAFT_33255 [Hypholoma sublateritium FD-334 SS-4]
MPVFANSLTREVGLKVGPTVLEVFVKHYFDRLRDDEAAESGGSLRKDDVLYNEAFTIIKSFLAASTFHTIEELQSFSNTRTPSPPWTHVVRVLVPMSSCDDAAPYLIAALGGPEVAKRLVGGVKWWQVRGINGVDGQWITAKKDYQEAKKRYKEQTKAGPADGSGPLPTKEDVKNSTDGTYNEDMDAMRCILYLHGGGYYFGSVDQERYSIQRLARKINGRVFAINYRLAPQYPFPCALHDALAAYLFLIRPPPNSLHRPVHPRHIIISGDSAGGGLSLALLQVIRDSGLPAPAGGVLISPWCDLTHSFPSVHTNTETDIIPESGLSFHKPSMLWPPPPEEISTRVNASIRFRIRQAFRADETSHRDSISTYDGRNSFSDAPAPVDPSTPVVEVTARVDPERVVVHDAVSGETIEVGEQLHFYATNSLLAHPLVSPVTAYLGGLPPLFFFAGDKEVLRDEVIYTAHKAAYPEQYPLDERAHTLYPVLNGKELSKPTPVHLQVYDDSPHILPILFSFSTPAKFCFRAMANFTKFVTNMPLTPVRSLSRKDSTAHGDRKPITRRQSLFEGFRQTLGPRRDTMPALHSPTSPTSPTSSTLVTSPTSFTTGYNPTLATPEITLTESPPALEHGALQKALSGPDSILRRSPSPLKPPATAHASLPPAHSPLASPTGSAHEALAAPQPTRGQALRRALSGSLARTGNLLRRSPSSSPALALRTPPASESAPPRLEEEEVPSMILGDAPRRSSPIQATPQKEASGASSDVAGPRFQLEPLTIEPRGERYAGEVDVYSDIPDPTNWPVRMIRERVSTAGVLSALEPEAELNALQVPRADVGHFGPRTMHRYLRDHRAFGKRFAHTAARIEKQRRRNLQRAREDTIRRMAAWRMALRRDASASESGAGHANGGANGSANPSAAAGTSGTASPGWGWAWALDDDEAPPPSSLVARRDTGEARRLAAVADEAMLGPAHTLSGNNLWAVVINFLTITPGKETHGYVHERKSREGSDQTGDNSSAEGTPRKSRLRHLRFWDREARGAGSGAKAGDGSSV